MKLRRLILSLLIVLSLTFGQMIHVYAEETSGSYSYTIKNNPQTLTQEVVDESFSSKTNASPKKFKASSSGNTFESTKEACAYIREGLVNREETITFMITYREVLNENSVRDYGMNLFDEATSHTGKEDEGDYIEWQFDECKQRCNYYIYQTYSKCIYSFTVSYYTTADEEATVTDSLNQVYDDLNLDGLNEYNKFMAIYEYVTHNVTYDHEHVDDESYLHQYTAYGALIDHTAVCQGYALLLYRMLLHVGIDTRLIPGYAYKTELHAWNIVKFDDYYYNVDSTWDAGDDNNYNYCLRPDTYFNKEHTRFVTYKTDDFYKQYPMYMAEYGQTIDVNPVISFPKMPSYTGKPIQPDLNVEIDEKVILSAYYTVDYADDAVKVGKYNVSITLKGGYVGEATAEFKIVPQSTSIKKLTAKSKGFKATWTKKSTQVTGYQIRYSTSSSMSSAKTKSITSYKTVSKTITKLKKKKKYYVQVRTYKTVSGTKYYSSWSAKKSIKTK